jgi:chromate transport protein ChrA
MILFGYGVAAFGNLADSAWLHGLKIVAVAVVAQAVWRMARNLCPDRKSATIAGDAAMRTLAVPSAPGQIGASAPGGLIDCRLLALWAVPPWLVVIFGAAAATIVAGIPAING